MAIRNDTNTSGAPTKVDNDMILAGHQKVTGGMINETVHLPYSPAQGFPLEDQAFDEGRGWSEVQGYLDPTSGKVDI